MTDLVFEPEDIDPELLTPGFYASTVASARLRTSAGGNRMIQVVHALLDVPPSLARLADYFVLEGASPHVLALTRRRLVDLFRIAGRAPRAGEPIVAGDLVGAQISVRVEHDMWRGRPRLRVVEYASRASHGFDRVPF